MSKAKRFSIYFLLFLLLFSCTSVLKAYGDVPYYQKVVDAVLNKDINDRYFTVKDEHIFFMANAIMDAAPFNTQVSSCEVLLWNVYDEVIVLKIKSTKLFFNTSYLVISTALGETVVGKQSMDKDLKELLKRYGKD